MIQPAPTTTTTSEPGIFASDASRRATAIPATARHATERQGSAPRPPRTMVRRARHSFEIDLTPADIEDDLSYGRD